MDQRLRSWMRPGSPAPSMPRRTGRGKFWGTISYCDYALTSGASCGAIYAINRTIILGKSRRIVLPKELCQGLHLEEGDALEVHIEGDSLRLRPRADEGVNLVREGELLVATGYPSGADVGAAVLADREDREETLTQVYRKGRSHRAR